MEVVDSTQPADAAAADCLSGSSGDYCATSDGGAAASTESTANEKPAVSFIEDLPPKSQSPPPSSAIDVSNRRFTHIPVRRVCEAHPNLRRVIRHRGFGPGLRAANRRMDRLSWRRFGRCGYLETLFELPVITEDNVVIFSKPQKIRRSVDEVDQLMKKLDLRKDKSKVT